MTPDAVLSLTDLHLVMMGRMPRLRTINGLQYTICSDDVSVWKSYGPIAIQISALQKLLDFMLAYSKELETPVSAQQDIDFYYKRQKAQRTSTRRIFSENRMYTNAGKALNHNFKQLDEFIKLRLKRAPTLITRTISEASGTA